MILKFFLIMFLIPLYSIAQSWAPIESKWYYDRTYAFSKDIDFIKAYCNSTKEVNGINCQVINIGPNACNNHFYGELYTYEKNNTIFFYNNDIDKFQILYNFNASVGDHWEIFTKDHKGIIDTVMISVVSINNTVINNQSLRKLNLKYHYNYNHGNGKRDIYDINSEAIEKIGDLDFIINIRSKYVGLCDIDVVKSLRCYEDLEIGNYSTKTRENCDYRYVHTSISNGQLNSKITVDFNPTSNLIAITSASSICFTFDLVDTSGILIKKGTESIINIADLPSGIYYLKVKINKNEFETIKLIKYLP